MARWPKSEGEGKEPDLLRRLQLHERSVRSAFDCSYFLSERPQLSHCVQHYIARCQAGRLGFLLSAALALFGTCFFRPAPGRLPPRIFDTFSIRPRYDVLCVCFGWAFDAIAFRGG
jgi:hypothetical protein